MIHNLRPNYKSYLLKLCTKRGLPLKGPEKKNLLCLEVVFLEQSSLTLNLGWSLALDHLCRVINDRWHNYRSHCNQSLWLQLAQHPSCEKNLIAEQNFTAKQCNFLRKKIYRKFFADFFFVNIFWLWTLQSKLCNIFFCKNLIYLDVSQLR